MSDPATILEHPDDWNMNEGPFAKACSQLGYRLITLADRDPAGPLSQDEERIFGRIRADVSQIGG